VLFLIFLRSCCQFCCLYRCGRSPVNRVVNIAVLVLLPIVSAILFVRSIDTSIYDIFSHIFLQYSIPILLSSDALVKSVNNNITVTERVEAGTVVLHLK